MYISDLLEGQKFFTQKSRHFGEIRTVEDVEDITNWNDNDKVYRLLISYYPCDQFGNANGSPVAYTKLDVVMK